MDNMNTLSGLPRLSGDFNRGYTKAIMDIEDLFNYIESDLAHHKKRLNNKLARELLTCALTNREKLRENRNGFIRWNCITKEFEWFNGKE
jgi:hypothetical protein